MEIFAIVCVLLVKVVGVRIKAREQVGLVVSGEGKVEVVTITLIPTSKLPGRHHSLGGDHDVDAPGHGGEPEQRRVTSLP